MSATNNPLAIAAMERAGEMPDLANVARTHLVREGVPQRRKLDYLPPGPLEWEDEHAPVLSESRLQAIVTGLPEGPDLAIRLAHAVEKEVASVLRPQLVESMEVVRALAAIVDEINFHPKRTPFDPIGMPARPEHPLHHTRPIAQAAQRLCARRGYLADGTLPTASTLPRQLNPEAALLARERGDKDYADVYRWLWSEAHRHGYARVIDAILAAPKGPSHG